MSFISSCELPDKEPQFLFAFLKGRFPETVQHSFPGACRFLFTSDSDDLRDIMHFLYFIIFIFPITLGAESNEKLWLKLQTYKNATGISDETMMSIWENSAFDGSTRNRRLSRRRRGSRQGKSVIIFLSLKN